MVDCLSDNKYFSMIDMECGYNLEEKLEEYNGRMHLQWYHFDFVVQK